MGTHVGARWEEEARGSWPILSPVATLRELLADLEAEYEDARGLVDALPDDAPEWDLPTPAEGWAVRDQVSHLAFFDDLGRMAMVEPEVFAVKAEGIIEGGRD